MQSMKLLALTAASLANANSVTITENGKQKTLYHVSGGSGEGSSLSLNHNGRFYLSESGNLDPKHFYTPNWLGGHIKYDMDLSQSGCSCNAAVYLVSMPGKNGDGSYNPSQGGDYYCDANYVGGVGCPEWDIQEANRYAFHTTPHKCDGPFGGGTYSNCDRGGGCFQKAADTGKYGEGKMIDTHRKFTVKHSWHEDGNFEVEFSQEGRSFTMGSNGGCNDYVNRMKPHLQRGMAIVVSNWGDAYGNMDWLDGGKCGGDCNSNPNISISNIEIKTGSSGPPPPPPPPGKDYDYGDACATTHDGECNGCGSCSWSWPKNDPAKWASHDAACRCKPFLAKGGYVAVDDTIPAQHSTNEFLY